jgi:hypothetical protein
LLLLLLYYYHCLNVIKCLVLYFVFVSFFHSCSRCNLALSCWVSMKINKNWIKLNWIEFLLTMSRSLRKILQWQIPTNLKNTIRTFSDLCYSQFDQLDLSRKYNSILRCLIFITVYSRRKHRDGLFILITFKGKVTVSLYHAHCLSSCT